LYIYDPSWDPTDASSVPVSPADDTQGGDQAEASSGKGKRRIRSLTFLTRVNDLIQESRNSKNTGVRRFFVGGGGNETGECQAMTAEWLERLVEAKAAGKEMELVGGWEELAL